MPRQSSSTLPLDDSLLSSPVTNAFPAVCRAGEFQFAPGQSHVNPQVQSRALFWCKSGRGRFSVNHVSYTLEPHDLYVLPWNRRIEYFASEKEPMFTAHVHIVPWMKPNTPWEPNVPHDMNEPLFDSPNRCDLTWPGYENVVRFHTGAEETLGRLINYATHWFRDSARSEEEGRALGLLFVHELQRHALRPSRSSNRHPEELTRLIVHIDRCFNESPTVENLAEILGRSRSHVLKLFQKHLHTTAKSYIMARQMKEARELLLSTTMPISEVGAACGFPDPYHFSKLFRRIVGMSPTAHRQLKGPLPISSSPSVHENTPSPPAD